MSEIYGAQNVIRTILGQSNNYAKIKYKEKQVYGKIKMEH